MKEYYSILGLNDGATADEVKKAYRKMSKKYHPDLNSNNKQAEEKFIEISNEWGVPILLQSPVAGEELNLIGIGDGKGGHMGIFGIKAGAPHYFVPGP